MLNVVPFLDNTRESKPSAAIFLSGSGSNAERILEACAQAGDSAPLKICAVVTDRPETSRAREIGASYGIPVVDLDIRAFYHERGEKRISLATPAGRAIRDRWTAELRKLIAPYSPCFAILAGFVSLTNITADFPCLNVHPGDLTYEKDGRRYLVGLHTRPVERAIIEGLDSMRSSVIVAVPYTGQGDDMDSGPILGLSDPVAVDLGGHSLAELRAVAASRPEKRPVGGFKDILEGIASANLEKLKIHGDWAVFPRAVFDFARGLFGMAGSRLCFKLGGKWVPIETVCYGQDGREIIFPDAP